MKACIFLFGLLLLSFGIKAQDGILGKWITIDDNTHKPKSIVNIYKKPNGEFYGKIVRLFRKPDEDQDPICDKCTDDRKNQKVIGMVIIRNMKWDADDKEWTGGTICDPHNGKVYTCKLWLEDDSLMVRGYVAFFFRTQTWVRLKRQK